MIFISIFALSLIVVPPPPKVTKLYDGGGNGWTFRNIDLQLASDTLSMFHKSYTDIENPADFSCNPILSTPVPQALLGFYKFEELRAVIHLLDYKQVCKVTSIAIACGDYEVANCLFNKIKETDNIEIDTIALKRQPRWLLTFHYYNTV